MCNTRAPSVGSYFSIQTQFAIVIATSTPINNPPVIQDVPVLAMLEDEGKLLANKFSFISSDAAILNHILQ